MHEKHRERLKNRFLAEGLDHFEPHNALELLLFFSIPQKDTNETAHRLLDRFGSVRGVLDADREELLKVPGIGEHSVTLLKLIPALARLYVTEPEKTKAVRLSTEEQIGRYLVGRYIGVGVETVYLLLLNNKYDMIDCVKVHEGSVNSSAITMRKLVDLAIERKASMAVLAHNHPNGTVIPSSDDMNTTMAIRSLFGRLDIPLLGHFIVAGD
ncbi:MAG: hypothetical protein KBS76_04370, partial [Ruminococcus sp.]|nr:hypothetical protein [Candidatus Apopatosoma intestinale]